MATLDTHAPSLPRSDKRRGGKPAASKPQKTRVAKAYAGNRVDLPKTLEKGMRSKRVGTVLIPVMVKAEDAHTSSKRFGRVRLIGPRKTGGRIKAIEGAKAVRRVVEAAVPGHVAVEAYEPDARARAILRGRKHAEADLRAAGGAYGVDEVRGILNGISRQAVDKRVNEGTLLAVPGPSGGRRFPTAQFDKHGGVVKGIKAVSTALGFSSPWAVLNFLVNENDRLAGRRPIDVLSDGEVEPVVAAAASIGVQGA